MRRGKGRAKMKWREVVSKDSQVQDIDADLVFDRAE